MKFSEQRRSLLSSPARIQVPWIKVTIGNYTFGVFSKTVKEQAKDNNGFYSQYSVSYPNYIQGLTVQKINGQVNQYTLNIVYPVRPTDDPNFFEKVFASVSNTRKIVFSYGDSAMPSYIYKDEEAIITNITQSFRLESSTIQYSVSAVSGAALSLSSNITFVGGVKKPSDEIKALFKNSKYGLSNTFTGMSTASLDKFIAGDDKAVLLDTKVNISALDLITYLVSCMVPVDSTTDNLSKEMYVLTLHDDTTYDRAYADPLIIDNKEVVGPYFKVTKTSTVMEHSDAYELDVGYNTSTIVTQFSIQNNENYSLFFDYQGKLNPEKYVRRINNRGLWQDEYAPGITSKNDNFRTLAEDTIWWTKVTQYPITATLTVQGLLRPASLMTYLRLNIIFPGGHRHQASGLYVITKQVDTIDGSGYRTQLTITRIAGDGPNVGMSNSMAGQGVIHLAGK